MPVGTSIGPLFAARDQVIEPLDTLVIYEIQSIGPGAPPGNYTCVAYIGEYGLEIWYQDGFPLTKLDATGIGANAQGSLPEAFNLSAFSNPFNAEVTLSFNLPQAAEVELSLYDLAGRSVATLVQGWRLAGAHQVTFSATELPSGIYLTRLQTSAATATQKLILSK